LANFKNKLEQNLNNSINVTAIIVNKIAIK